MIDALLLELASAGWTVSWAFQFEPGHWRVSIIHYIDDKVHLSSCADAPSFAEALEDAMSRMAEAEIEDIERPSYSLTPAAKGGLLAALGLTSTSNLPITRRRV